MDSTLPGAIAVQPRAAATDDDTGAESDQALAQAATHSQAAFARLYRRHVKRIYGYLLARVGNVQDAQDLTSQTFLAAWESIGAYGGRGSFVAWLFGIARHKLHDHFRRQKSNLPLEAAEQAAHPGSPPDKVVGRQLQVEQLALALRSIAPERAEALAWRVFGGLSTAEVGQVMGKSEAAVRMLVHRGVRDLQERLAFLEAEK
jgi:RNA polymerase sigma-70 factor (ECF subfamily)